MIEIYFHSSLWSYLPRVLIILSTTVCVCVCVWDQIGLNSFINVWTILSVNEMYEQL